jgi:hypothetical protein
MIGEVTIFTKFSHHVQMERCLEGEKEFEEEGLAGSQRELLHDMGFTYCVFELVVLNKELFFHHFHSHDQA